MYLRQATALAARRATAGSVRKLATGKDVKFGVEGRALMLQGVDMLADAVQVREETGGSLLRLVACSPNAAGWSVPLQVPTNPRSKKQSTSSVYVGC